MPHTTCKTSALCSCCLRVTLKQRGKGAITLWCRWVVDTFGALSQGWMQVLLGFLGNLCPTLVSLSLPRFDSCPKRSFGLWCSAEGTSKLNQEMWNQLGCVYGGSGLDQELWALLRRLYGGNSLFPQSCYRNSECNRPHAAPRELTLCSPGKSSMQFSPTSLSPESLNNCLAIIPI